MTQQELDAARQAHWESSARALNRLQWFVSVFGVAAIGALFAAGVGWQTIAEHTSRLAAHDRRLEAHDVRVRDVERASTSIEATLRGQSDTLREISAEQRAIRELLSTYLMREERRQ